MLADKAVIVDGAVDLEATLELLQDDLRFFERELAKMREFQQKWNAAWEDVSDHREDQAESSVKHRAAIDHVEAILAALR